MKRGLSCVLLVLAACQPEPEASISSFSATPEIIDVDGATTLEWKSTATNCLIQPGSLSVEGSGSKSISPATTTQFTLSCGSSTANTLVTVRGAVSLDSFKSEFSEVGPGDTVTLSWATTNSTGCTLSPGNISVPANGTHEVTVTAATTYALSCAGARGPVTKSLMVGIANAGNLALAGSDGTITVTWTPGGRANVYFAAASGITPANITTLTGGLKYALVTSPLAVHGLTAGQTYYARVATATDTAEGALTAEASGTVPAAPTTADPLFGAQWFLFNTGQEGGTAGEDIRAAGALSQNIDGTGIRVAVVDEGVDIDHEDLAANHATLLDYDYIHGATVDLAEHGTCVAGLALERGFNGIGGRGVAPKANFVSYNILQDLTSANEYDAMTRGKVTNHVSTNSWGDSDDNTGLLSEATPEWVRGVTEGTTTGRGGKGTIYTWAAGNGADGMWVDNSNFDSQANSRFVFAIGGVGDDGKIAYYAEEGANLLVVAPTGGRADHALTTTDITGLDGYNDGATDGEISNANYTQLMDGTSASTPIVAGVVALVLQANPALTWRDVRRVLAMSARKNDATDGDWAINGAGLHVNHKYGFGTVDAAAAVTLAKTFVAGAPERNFNSAANSPHTAIPDNGTGISDAIAVSNSMVGHLEFVEIIASIAHPRSGDLTITLEHSGGVASVLHPQHRCYPDQTTHQEVCSDIDAYTFGSDRNLDEPADGTWTLKVTDGRTGQTGTLDTWQLKFYGRP